MVFPDNSNYCEVHCGVCVVVREWCWNNIVRHSSAMSW